MYSFVFVAVNRIRLFFVSSSAQNRQRTVRIQLTLWLSVLAAEQKSALVATNFYVFLSFFLAFFA